MKFGSDVEHPKGFHRFKYQGDRLDESRVNTGQSFNRGKQNGGRVDQKCSDRDEINTAGGNAHGEIRSMLSDSSVRWVMSKCEKTRSELDFLD